MRIIRSPVPSLLPCFLALAAPLSATAQSGGDGILEEIVVTAQKREQAAIDVPITLTAYSGEFLETVGIEEFDRLSQFVPGLVVQEQSVNNPGFVIRGITSDSGSAQIAPRVSVYQDGVDISRSRGSIVELHDLERVEVLRGPQATLFGSAASIGAIELISARPTDELAARISLGAGNFEERRISGFVSGPFGDSPVSGRFAWIYKEREGFIDNIDGAPGSQDADGPGAEALNGTETLALRAYLLAEPGDDLELALIVNYQEDTPPGTSFKSGTIPPTGGDTSPNSFAELGPFGNEASAFLGGPLGIDRETTSITGRIVWRWSDAFQLESITNYREFDSLEVFDADGTAAYWLEFAEDAEGEQYSQEIRVNYDPGGRFRGFAGVSFFHEEGEQRVPFTTDEGVFAACSGFAPGLPCVNADGSVNSIFPAPLIYEDFFGNTGETDSYSLYADGTYAFTERFELTLGVRLVTEEKESGFFQLGTPAVLTGGLTPLLNFGATGGAVVRSGTESFDDVLPRLNARFSASDDVELYLTVGKGRVGNVIDVSGTTGGPADPEPIVTVLPEEIVWNYEVGLKSRLFGGRARYDLGIFHQEYENFQTTIFDPDTGDATPVNAGSASNTGVEAALSAQATDGLDLFANLAWLDAEFDDTDEDGNPQVFGGNRFRLQPEWSASAGGTYRLELGRYAASGTLTWTYRSDVFFENANQPIAGLEIAESDLTLVDLRIGFGPADGPWRFSAYAENLFDEEYVIDAGNTGGTFGTPTFIAGPPRFYGAAFEWSFE